MIYLRNIITLIIFILTKNEPEWISLIVLLIVDINTKYLTDGHDCAQSVLSPIDVRANTTLISV